MQCWYQHYQVILIESHLWRYSCMEPWIVLAASVATAVAVAVDTRASCITGASIVLLLYACQLAVVLRWRPRTTLLDNVWTSVTLALTVGSLVAALGFVITYGSLWILFAMVFQLILGVLNCLEGVRTVVSTAVVVWRLFRRLSAPAYSRSPKALLVERDDADKPVWGEDLESVDDAFPQQVPHDAVKEMQDIHEMLHTTDQAQEMLGQHSYFREDLEIAYSALLRPNDDATRLADDDFTDMMMCFSEEDDATASLAQIVT
jgi:hypothetical protein